MATYTCNDPYILSENSNPICEASAVGAMWSGSQPTCNFPDFNNGKYMHNYYNYNPHFFADLLCIRYNLRTPLDSVKELCVIVRLN